MWRPLVQLAALVLLHGVAAIDVHGAVGVDGHHHLPDVAVDPPLLKPEGAARVLVKDRDHRFCVQETDQVCMWQVLAVSSPNVSRLSTGQLLHISLLTRITNMVLVLLL